MNAITAADVLDIFAQYDVDVTPQEAADEAAYGNENGATLDSVHKWARQYRASDLGDSREAAWFEAHR